VMLFGSFADLDFSFLEMNPFTLVNGEPVSSGYERRTR